VAQARLSVLPYVHVWIERTDGKPMRVTDYLTLVACFAMICFCSGLATYLVVRRIRKT
jgi:hypothetical protein